MCLPQHLHSNTARKEICTASSYPGRLGCRAMHLATMCNMCFSTVRGCRSCQRQVSDHCWCECRAVYMPATITTCNIYKSDSP